MHRAKKRKKGKAVQEMLPFRNWGGPRAGAGRKRQSVRPNTSHRTRVRVGSGCPILITMRLLQGLPSLRTRAALKVLWECFARGSERAGFAVCEFSIQRDHLHLIVEACGREVLSRGMQSSLAAGRASPSASPAL